MCCFWPSFPDGSFKGPFPRHLTTPCGVWHNSVPPQISRVLLGSLVDDDLVQAAKRKVDRPAGLDSDMVRNQLMLIPEARRHLGEPIQFQHRRQPCHWTRLALAKADGDIAAIKGHR